MKLPYLSFPLRRKPATSDGQRTDPDLAEDAAAPETSTAYWTFTFLPHSVGLGKLTGRLRSYGSGSPWLLLAWDISGLRATVAKNERQRCTILARAQSSEAYFGTALSDVIGQLRAQLRGSEHNIPRRAALAARHQRPAVVNLPVNPDKPRPDAQMRELLRSDMEPLLAEFVGLWTMGALLHARGHLTSAEQECVVLEQASRRGDRRTPLRYGETALELSLIDRTMLNECMELQEWLQLPDSELLSTWKGRLDHGEKHWLASVLSARLHRQWEEALAGHGISLDTVLPLAWLASENEDADSGTAREIQQISLELHLEEIVAVRRQHGLIVAARTEGRMERPLESTWMQRLIEDWSIEARAELSLYCLDATDEIAALQAASDLELTNGHPVRLVTANAVWDGLWPALLREAATVTPNYRLPRLTKRQLRGKPWKNPDILRVASLTAVVMALAATEGAQSYRLHLLNQKMTEVAKKENEEQKLAQLTAKAGTEIQQLARELEVTRTALEPLLNERTRLEAIAAMRQYLPDLMLMLAQAVGSDAVLEKVGNSRDGGDATAIRVEAWSPSYTGAQDFINRVAEQTRTLAYGVAQTEIREERGRTGRNGYRVGFWLVQEPDELEQPPVTDTTNAAPQRKG